MLAGNQVAMDRWILIADAHTRVGTENSDAAGGRGEVRASVALLRALRGDTGFDGIGEPATAALEHLSPISPWRPLALFMIGVGCLLTDEPGRAVGHLLAAESLAAGFGGHVVRSDCLITLGLLALQEGQWEEGAALVGRAREVLAANGIEGLATSGYPLSVLASVQARGGDAPGARRSLAVARELGPALARIRALVAGSRPDFPGRREPAPERRPGGQGGAPRGARAV